jgi:hypothetical protein
MEIINRSIDNNGHPLVLWRRKGDHHRRLTGSTPDWHVWTVKVPGQMWTVEEALEWMCEQSVGKGRGGDK